MTYSTLMSTFLGSGLAASIPVAATIAATVPPGWVALYFATDTPALYGIANGESAWTDLTGAGGGTIEVTDGTNDFTGISKLLFSGATVSNPTAGEAEVLITGGGGAPWDFSPPLAASMATFNILGSVLPVLTDNSDVGLLINQATGNNESLVYRTLTTPSLAWDMVVKLRGFVESTTYNAIGVSAWETSGSKRFALETAGSPAVVVTESTGGGVISTLTINPGPDFEWYRMTSDGTNLTSYISSDGKLWTQTGQVSISTATSSAPERVGIFVQSYANSSNWPQNCSCPYFSLTGPAV